MTLPPLPVTHVVIDGLWEDVHGPYSADDMRAYAQAAVLAERAACAKACDQWTGRNDISGDALLAIRARGE